LSLEGWTGSLTVGESLNGKPQYTPWQGLKPVTKDKFGIVLTLLDTGTNSSERPPKPLDEPATLEPIISRKLTALAVELVPRTTLAQSMDALSSLGDGCRLQSRACILQRTRIST
jgi:hypothetical protein